MTITSKPDGVGAQTPTSPPKATPVKLFAGIGVLVLVLIVYVMTRWITSPQFTPSPVGPDPIPTSTLVAVRGTEAFFVVFSAYFGWRLLIKPWIRERKLPWDGLLMLALFTMWILDPMCNYFNFTFMYNAHFVNMGSWASFLPGWQSPRGSNLPEPLLFMGGIYLWWTTISVIVFSWSLKKLRVWLPNWSTLAHVPIAFLSILVIDAALELPAVHLGIYAYAGAPHSLTLWAGHPYQMPIYELFFINFNYLFMGLVRYYRNDRGESWAERGISTMQISAGAKTFVRWLALVGICNAGYFLLYFMPYNWLALQADTLPPYPSYMRVEICGQGTPYACPSREVPVPSNGTLAPVGPTDPRLSPTARQN